MTTKEAINMIRQIERDYPAECAAVFDMVIKALKKQDAVEPISPLSPTQSNIHFCGKCMYLIGEHDNYCS